MNNPELYSKFNSVTRATAVQLLDEYSGKIKWRIYNESVMDMGCGDGAVTNIIKKYIPTEVVRFDAIDISEKMVEYAKEHYSKENITFRVLDMEGDMPNELQHNFNHVFSFFVMQFIRNQEKVFRNVFDLLPEGGDCFLCFLKYVPFYDLFLQASQQNKWKSWIKDINKFISPYYYVDDPEEKIRQMMEKIGFTDIDVQCRKMTHVMKNGNEFKSLLKAVEPYNMPSDVFEDFMKDSKPLAQQLGLLDNTNTGFEGHNKPVDFNYNVLIVYATKP